MNDPADVDEYVELQEAIHETIGFGGVNIIDSVDDRMRLFVEEPNPVEAATAYFLRMRTRFARMGGQSAIHIQDVTLPKKFEQVLRGRQDGTIELRRAKRKHGHVRQLRVTHLRNRSPDTRWHEFVIHSDRVTIFRRD